MKLGGIVIAMLVFALVMLGLSNFTADYVSQYNLSSENLSSIVKIQQIQNTTNSIAQTFNSSTTVTDNPFNLPFTLGTGAFKILKLVFFDMIDLYSSFVGTIATYLHIPATYVGIIISIVIVAIMFLIISAILKWKV